MLIGVTKDLDEARTGFPPPMKEYATGSSFECYPYGQPDDSNPLYLVLIQHYSGGSIPADFTTTKGDFTINGVWWNSDYLGTDATIAAVSGQESGTMRAVLSILDDGNETDVSTTVGIDPLGFGGTITLTITFLDSADDPTEVTTRKSLDFQRWYVCTVCGHQAPRGEMGLIGGTPYCHRYGCYEDEIEEMRRRARSK